MSWCPNCKTEYREGITVCADCGSPLVDELKEDNTQCVAVFDKEDSANKFSEFLTYSEITEVHVAFSDEEKGFAVYVAEEHLTDAKKLYRAFDLSETKKERETKKEAEEDEKNPFSQTFEDAFANAYEEAFEEAEENNVDVSDVDVEIPLETVIPKSSVTYVKKEERYNDFRSTFYIFLIFGVLGIAFTILNMTEIITLFSSWMQYIVLGAISIIFVIIAIVSYNKSKTLFDEIDYEKEVTSSIKAWLNENITEETLSQFENDVDAKEVIFLRKIEYIKKCLNDHYTFDNDTYVDELIEEFYNETFEK